MNWKRQSLIWGGFRRMYEWQCMHYNARFVPVKSISCFKKIKFTVLMWKWGPLENKWLVFWRWKKWEQTSLQTLIKHLLTNRNFESYLAFKKRWETQKQKKTEGKGGVDLNPKESKLERYDIHTRAVMCNFIQQFQHLFFNMGRFWWRHTYQWYAVI